jgi:hypothetical protein
MAKCTVMVPYSSASGGWLAQLKGRDRYDMTIAMFLTD